MTKTATAIPDEGRNKPVPMYISLTEAGHIAGVSRNTIDEWTRHAVNPLPAYRLPGMTLRKIKRQDLLDWLSVKPCNL